MYTHLYMYIQRIYTYTYKQYTPVLQLDSEKGGGFFLPLRCTLYTPVLPSLSLSHTRPCTHTRTRTLLWHVSSRPLHSTLLSSLTFAIKKIRGIKNISRNNVSLAGADWASADEVAGCRERNSSRGSEAVANVVRHLGHRSPAAVLLLPPPPPTCPFVYRLSESKACRWARRTGQS